MVFPQMIFFGCLSELMNHREGPEGVPRGKLRKPQHKLLSFRRRDDGLWWNDKIAANDSLLCNDTVNREWCDLVYCLLVVWFQHGSLVHQYWDILVSLKWCLLFLTCGRVCCQLEFKVILFRELCLDGHFVSSLLRPVSEQITKWQRILNRFSQVEECLAIVKPPGIRHSTKWVPPDLVHSFRCPVNGFTEVSVRTGVYLNKCFWAPGEKMEVRLSAAIITSY